MKLKAALARYCVEGLLAVVVKPSIVQLADSTISPVATKGSVAA